MINSKLGKSSGLLVMGLLFGAAVVGCGGIDKGPDRYNLKGQITFDGEPIPYGVIKFIPNTTKGNKGPAGYANIKNGEYNTATEGAGVVGGPHRVLITGYDGQAKPEDELPHGTPLFQEYEIQYDLPELDTPEEEKKVDFKVPENATDAPPRRRQSA